MQEQNSAPVAQNPADEVKVQAKNFAELRSIAESAKQENLQLKQRLQQLEEAVKKVPAPSHEDGDDEPYVDQKRLSREMGKLKESFSSEIDKKAEEKARALIEEERRKDYLEANKDFYDVLQKEELQKFIDSQPNLVKRLEKMPDNFERQQLVYEMIKSFKDLRPSQPQAPAAPKSQLAQAFDGRKAQMAYQPGGSSGGPFQSIGDFSQGGMKNAYDRFMSLKKSVNL